MKLKVLVLYCDKLNECLKFYSSFGYLFNEAKDGFAPSNFVGISADDEMMIFIYRAIVPNSRMMLIFESSDLGGIVANLVSNGFRHMQMKHENKILAEISLTDPEGRRIIVNKK